ncbi:MAG TPA: TIM barrel protein [Opitutaceae bacterium]|nr:TIM barrel protein [Opitutaceae bacterium]
MSEITPTAFPHVSRRDFLIKSTLAASALAATRASALSQTPSIASGNQTRWPLCVFTKPFQELNPREMAALVADVGWDGVEIPVRSKGQVEPEKVADLLPAYAEALRAQKKDIYVATTDLTRIDQKHGETVLRTISKLGIKKIRLGFFKYDLTRSPALQLPAIGDALKDIAIACRELGLQAGFQNHSGKTYVGAPVWDVYSLIKDMNPRELGFCFDIAHATIEGGLAWPLHAKLAEPFYTAVFVKDYVWKKTDKGWKETWCQLGEGMVDRAFFEGLKKSSYQGPLCQHHEYRWSDRAQMISMMRQDLQVLRTWVS